MTDDQQKWIDALKSGEYRQIQRRLGVMRHGKEYNCCLGVACRVFNVPRSVSSQYNIVQYNIVQYGESIVFPPIELAERLGIRSIQARLERMNDESNSYDSVINFLEGYFEETKTHVADIPAPL